MKLHVLFEDDSHLLQLVRAVKADPDDLDAWDAAFRESKRAGRFLIFTDPRDHGIYAVVNVSRWTDHRGHVNGSIDGRLTGARGPNQAVNLSFRVEAGSTNQHVIAKSLTLDSGQQAIPSPPKDSSDCRLGGEAGISHGGRCGCKSSPDDPYGEAWLRRHRSEQPQ